MPYRDEIPAQFPNATEHEKVAQASEILERLAKGQSTRAVAAAMSISRHTLYERLELINRPLPSVDLVRVIHFERLENMVEGVQERLDGDEISDADYFRGVAEQRQVLARQSSLLRVETTDPTPPEPDDAPDNWVAGARDDADAELADAERELMERRNGLAS